MLVLVFKMRWWVYQHTIQSSLFLATRIDYKRSSHFQQSLLSIFQPSSLNQLANWWISSNGNDRCWTFFHRERVTNGRENRRAGYFQANKSLTTKGRGFPTALLMQRETARRRKKRVRLGRIHALLEYNPCAEGSRGPPLYYLRSPPPFMCTRAL